jgi:hypothetical protein
MSHNTNVMWIFSIFFYPGVGLTIAKNHVNSNLVIGKKNKPLPPHHHHIGDHYNLGNSRQPRKLVFGIELYFSVSHIILE